MKIQNILEMLHLVSEAAHKQASKIQEAANKPYDIQACQLWEKIGQIIDRAVGEIEALPRDGGGRKSAHDSTQSNL